MKEKLESLKYSFVIMISLLLCLVAFVSCGDDDEEVVGDNIYYSAVLEGEYEGNVDVMIKETTEIKEAFSESLGVDLSKGVNFHYVGTLDKCDIQVRNACTEAKASLAGKTWLGYYVIVVTNENTDTKIYEYTFGTRKE